VLNRELMTPRWLITLVFCLPTTLLAQSNEGERISFSLVAAVGRASFDTNPTQATFYPRGLQHLGIRLEYSWSRFLATRVGVGRSNRHSRYQVPSSPRVNVGVLTTDATMGARFRVAERPRWSFHLVGEIGRSFIQSARMSDPTTNVAFARLETEPAEWSVIPGVELTLLASQRLTAAAAYRYGVDDALLGGRSRTRVLELRAGFAVLRF